MLESLVINVASSLLTSRYAVYAFLFALVFWLLWVNLNILHNRMEKRTGLKKIVIAVVFWPLLILGALVDVVFNKTIGSLLFLEWGCETTLSMRLTRYISKRTCNKHGQAEYGYRTPFAVWVATWLVEPWQPGHIGIEKYGYPPAQNLIDKFISRYKRLLP